MTEDDDDDSLEVTEELSLTDSTHFSIDADSSSITTDDIDFEDDDDDEIGALALGLDPELAKDLDRITKDTGGKHTASIRARDTDPDPIVPWSASSSADAVEFKSYEVEVKHDDVNTLLKHVYEKLQERMDDGYEVDTLILGLPQYRILQPWSWAEHNQDISVTLPVDDIILVPGPMLHPVVDNHVLWHEYLEEREMGDS